MSRRLRSITTNRDMGEIMRLSQNGHKGGLVGRRRGDEAITPTSTKEMVTATGLSSQTEMEALVDPDPMVVPPFAVRVLNHLTYGPTSTDVAAFRALGSSDVVRLTNFVDQQLNPGAIPDETVDSILAAMNPDGTKNYDALHMTLEQQWVRYYDNNTSTRDGETPATQTQLAAFVRAVYTKRQVYEKVVAFWHDHFNVYYKEGGATSTFASYTNDVIRPNALGNFRVLLETVTKSAAMMFYLDNRASDAGAPNENFARELLELHTLGAERYKSPSEVSQDPEDARFANGYVEADVLAAARALTGWKINLDTAAFHYADSKHDKDEKKILGVTLAQGRGKEDGEDLLDIVAQHPGTARFICTKLIRFFVMDEPSPSAAVLVDSASKIFRDNWLHPDQIKITLRHILLSKELQSSWQQKVRRPGEVVIAAFRAVGTEWRPKWTLQIPGREDATPETALMARLSRTGHGTYEWTPPNGYPDVKRPWLATNSMAALWRLLSWLPQHKTIPTGDESTAVLPILRVSRAEVPSWTAGALVNFWCRRLLGYLPKESHRQVLVGFLLQNGDRTTFVVPDTNVENTTDPKNHRCQDRIKAMVSMILMSPEFMSR